MKSKTKIEKQLTKKTNPELVETIVLAKKNPAWITVAHLMTTPRRKLKNYNLGEIDKLEESVVVVSGKVLGSGEITKKKKIIAFSFSNEAVDKLKKAGCDVVLIKDEIKKNKEAKEVYFLK